jgi:methylphosphotriester-DNA--protein-cysteine methyltransferase
VQASPLSRTACSPEECQFPGNPPPGVSERYLRRVFTQGVGISPKHFARISRVRKVLGRPGSWSAVAAEAGDFDQSHLVAEFRSIMRVTPGAFEAGRVPVTTC